jgi:acetylornithine deacetylase
LPLDPIAIALELIDIPSPTGDEPAVCHALERILRQLGFQCSRQQLDDDRFNLLAVTDERPRVLLCSHTDTVPPFIASSEDDDYVYGRGACDTKGIIAAMISAGERLIDEGVREFGYLFVVGEETDSIGAKRANEHFANIGSEFVIVGEPTESRFVRASKGAFTATVGFGGTAAHSAHPERGDSAIVKLVAALSEINSTDWGHHQLLGTATVNVGVIRGGERPNIVPAKAEAEMIFRCVDPPELVEQQLRSIVGKHGGEILKCHGNPPVFMVVPEGESSVVVAFNTDVPHLGRLGKPLLFGPGSILDAHSEGEKIGKSEILSAVRTYRDLVVSLLQGRVEGA